MTGTGVVAQYVDYSVETDGRLHSTASSATASDLRNLAIWNDWLGRTASTSKPGFTGQVAYSETMSYDGTTGLLTKRSRTGYADTLCDYNSMAQLIRTTLDVSGGGVQFALSDRIT